MFAHLSAISTLALVSLAAAHGKHHTHGARDAARCTTGALQCCNSVVDSQSHSGTAILGLVGMAAEDVAGLVGVGCTPITVGVSVSQSCTAKPVCCRDSSVGSGVSVGCVPVSL